MPTTPIRCVISTSPSTVMRRCCILLRTTYDPEDWRVLQPELPIRFLSGGEDPCRGNDQKFEQAAELLRSVGYRNVTSRLFPEMRHEILNETHRELVYQDVLETLEQWLSRS
ncbi:MAG: alpha/beta hydrolase [Ruminococcus sp.]